MSSRRRRHNVSSEGDGGDTTSDGNDDGETMEDNVTLSSSINIPAALSQFVRSGEDGDSHCGIIEKITLKNVMTHSFISIDFIKQMNFITGQNGSGKTAVLSAITIGLGGKAALAGRGNSITGFISDNKNQAEIRIWLRNKGEDAYKHDDYGDSIIVERRINSNKVSDYKLKTASGKVVSTLKETLTNILHHFNIQVDNPLTILNQEQCKSFLHSKSAVDFYKYFLKATQLEELKNTHRKIEEDVEDLDEKIAHKTNAWQTSQKKCTALEHKAKALENMNGLRKQLDDTKHELAWTIVKIKETAVDEVVQRMTKSEDDLTKTKESIVAYGPKLQKALDDKDQCGEDLREVVEQVDAAEEDCKEQRREQKQLDKVVYAKQRRTKDQHAEVRNTRKNLEELRKQIAKGRSEDQEDRERENREREATIAALEESIKGSKAREDTARRDVHQFDEQAHHLDQKEQDIQNEVKEADRDVHNLERQLQDFRNRGGRNDLGRFAHYMPNLIRAIEEAWERKRFHHKPRGPMGAFLKLRSKEHGVAVEACLGGLMNAFCVHNSHDSGALMEIIKRVVPRGRGAGAGPLVIMSTFMDRVHNVPNTSHQRGGHPTLLELLEISDPVIANTLIDQRGIESVVFIADGATARKAMLRKELGPSIRQCLDREGNVIIHARSFKVNSNRTQCRHVLSTDVANEIREVTASIADKNTQRRQIQGRLQEVKAEKNGQRKEAANARNLLRSRTSDRKRLEFEVLQLRSEEEIAPVSVNVLEEEAADHETKLEKLKEDAIAMEKELQELQEAVDQLKEREQELADKKAAKKSIVTSAQERLKEAEVQHTGDDQAMRFFHEKKRSLEKDFAALKVNIKLVKKELDEELERASAVGSRIDCQRSCEEVIASASRLEKQLTAEKELCGDPEEIRRQYSAASETLSISRKALADCKRHSRLLHGCLKTRAVRFDEICAAVTTRMRCYFYHILQSRDLQGDMVVDHVTKTLTINVIVQPKSRGKNSEVPKKVSKRKSTAEKEETLHFVDLKTLSGGEKTFTTLCLMLSLWNCMEAPFRAMDEFDVFMDPVARELSIDLLVRNGLMFPCHQFIILSPKELKVDPHAHIGIYEMPKKVRSGMEQDAASSQSKRKRKE